MNSLNKPTVVVDIKDLSYIRGGSVILDRVNLTVHENDFIMMIGPNGGGKTTLIKLILNLIKPTKGQIKIFGKLAGNNQNVSYVPQEININREFPITVMDVVLMGIKYRKNFCNFGTRKAKTEAIKILEIMEISQYRNKKISGLSGGQQQRVLIARALIAKPKLIFMDEPTANIDASGQTSFYKLLKEVNKKTTIVVASHDIMVLSSCARSIVCVNKSVHFHGHSRITSAMLNKTYGCPVELLTHGIVPHRVLSEH